MLGLLESCKATELMERVAEAKRDEEVAKRKAAAAAAELLALLVENEEDEYEDGAHRALVVHKKGARSIDSKKLRELYPTIAQQVEKVGKETTYVTVKPSKVA